MFSVTNKAAEGLTASTSIVRIYDEIGFWGISPTDILDMIDGIEGDEIELRVNSPGGNVFDGITILTSLMALKKPIHGFVDGMAASIASVLLMAADDITMPENTRLMIHNPQVFAGGDAREFRKTAETLDMVKSDIIATYRRHATISSGTISALMDDETFISAKAAVDQGFAHNFVRISKEEDEGDNPTNNTSTTKAQARLALLELEE